MGLDLSHWKDLEAGNESSVALATETRLLLERLLGPYSERRMVADQKRVDEVAHLDMELQRMQWKVTLVLCLVVVLALVAGVLACLTPAWWFGSCQLVIAGAAPISGVSFRILSENTLRAHKLLIPILSLFEVFMMFGVVSEHDWALPEYEIASMVCAFLSVLLYAIFACYAAAAATVVAKRQRLLYLHELARDPHSFLSYAAGIQPAHLLFAFAQTTVT